MRVRPIHLITGAVLFALALAAQHLVPRDAGLADFLAEYTPAVFALAALLGLVSRRSRVAFAAGAISLGQQTIVMYASEINSASELGRYAFGAIALGLPLTLGILAMCGNRGPFTVASLWQLLLVVAVSALLTFYWVANYELAISWFSAPVINAGKHVVIGLGQGPATLFILAAVLAVSFSFHRREGVQYSFFWVILASFFALADVNSAAGNAFFTSTAVILAVSVVQSMLTMAFRDPLTGLANRRALEDALHATGGGFSMAMVDIDHFKAVNDTHGHDVGDQVLRMVGGKLGQIGGKGQAFRFGGEEFAVLFNNLTAKQALAYVDAVRSEIESSSFTLRSADRPSKKPNKTQREKGRRGVLKVTVSGGIAETKGGQESAKDVLARADQALYRAKEAGRNKVIISG